MLESGLRYERQYLRARFAGDAPTTWPATYLDPGIRSEKRSTCSFLVPPPAGLFFLGSPVSPVASARPNLDDLVKFRENNGFIQVP